MSDNFQLKDLKLLLSARQSTSMICIKMIWSLIVCWTPFTNEHEGIVYLDLASVIKYEQYLIHWKANTKTFVLLCKRLLNEDLMIMITSKTLTKDSPMQRPMSPPTLETRLACVNPYKKALRRMKRLLQDLVQDIFLHIWWWDERNNFCKILSAIIHNDCFEFLKLIGRHIGQTFNFCKSWKTFKPTVLFLISEESNNIIIFIFNLTWNLRILIKILIIIGTEFWKCCS